LGSGDVNDYQNFNGKSINNLTDPGYDGANVYGDEGGLSNNLILTGVPTHVSRTGYLEKDLTIMIANYFTQMRRWFIKFQIVPEFHILTGLVTWMEFLQDITS